MALASDGTRLVSAGADHTVRAWDTTTGSPLGSIRVGHALSHVRLCAGRIIAAGERGPHFLTVVDAC
jgi:WD40 repeat protein